jgi:hypothetical protein
MYILCKINFQSIIFHVETHPQYLWFTQCVTFHFFPTPMHELAYDLFNMITVYGLPLLIITASYSLILNEISKKTQQSKGMDYTIVSLIIYNALDGTLLSTTLFKVGYIQYSSITSRPPFWNFPDMPLDL